MLSTSSHAVSRSETELEPVSGYGYTGTGFVPAGSGTGVMGRDIPITTGEE